MALSKGQLILAGIAVLVVLLVLWFFGTYNSFVSLDQGVNNSWAKVETQYQRRVDLIPNLVSTIQGSGNFEQETLTKLSELRTQWQTQSEQSQRVQTANELESTISKLLLVAENYPTLQTTQAYRDLLVQLEGTENRVAFARNEFNDTIKSYNTAIKQIPGSLIAGFMGLKEKEFFEAITEGAENAPAVDFE
ncbi:MAG: LemA family protein [Candidatus Diapherotrites archaeon]|nr:LemA family protein [Candidatus Diapherotrites archaeon]